MSDNKYNDDYKAANEALIRREEAKLERNKQKAEALEQNMTFAFGDALKKFKKALAKDASRAVKRAESGSLSPAEKAMIDAFRSGSDRVFIDEGPITGEDMSPIYDEDDDF